MQIVRLQFTYRTPGAVRRELPWKGERLKYCSVLLSPTCFPFACSFASSVCLGHHITSRPPPPPITSHHTTSHRIVSLQHVSKVTSKMTSKMIPNELQNELQNDPQNGSKTSPKTKPKTAHLPDPFRPPSGPVPAPRKSALLYSKDATLRPYRDPLTSPPNCASGVSIGRSWRPPSDAL